MFPKKKRVQDKALIEALQDVGCVICDESPNDVHHVTTRGAGGHDTLQNLMPLCRYHHQKVHSIGLISFAKRYEAVNDWLKDYGRLDLIEEFDQSLH